MGGGNRGPWGNGDDERVAAGRGGSSRGGLHAPRQLAAPLFCSWCLLPASVSAKCSTRRFISTGSKHLSTRVVFLAEECLQHLHCQLNDPLSCALTAGLVCSLCFWLFAGLLFGGSSNCSVWESHQRCVLTCVGFRFTRNGAPRCESNTLDVR